MQQDILSLCIVVDTLDRLITRNSKKSWHKMAKIKADFGENSKNHSKIIA